VELGPLPLACARWLGLYWPLSPPSAPKMADNLTREQRSRAMSLVKGRDTGPERLVRSIAHRLGYRFRLHRRDLPGKPDIVFPARKAAIFVHGCFWHGHKCRRGKLPTSNADFWKAKIAGNKKRDAVALRSLHRECWRTLVLWQCELEPERTARRLKRFLDVRAT
jgi:DNA mismatch endonuclease, patch repair protein